MAYYPHGQANPAMKYELQDQGPSRPPGPIMSPATGVTVVTTSRPRWSWCSTVWAAISVWCCPIFGFVATLMSVFSYVDHKSGDFDRSASKRRCSWGFSIAAIVIGVLWIVGIIVLYALVWRAVSNTNYYYNG